MGGKKERRRGGHCQEQNTRDNSLHNLSFAYTRVKPDQGEREKPNPKTELGQDLGGWNGDVHFRKPKASLKGGQAKKRPTRQGA
jgi:hypothetical protein